MKRLVCDWYPYHFTMTSPLPAISSLSLHLHPVIRKYTVEPRESGSVKRRSKPEENSADKAQQRSVPVLHPLVVAVRPYL